MAITTKTETTIDPGYRRLSVAIVLQAAKDMTSPDPIRSLDALLWLLFGGADFYLDILDIEGGAPVFLRMVQANGGNKHGWKKNRFARLIG